MIRFSAHLGMLFTEKPFLRRFECAAEAGFGAVEIWSANEAPVHELCSAIRDSGVQLVQFNLEGGDPAAGECGFLAVPYAQRRFRSGFVLSLEKAARLGVRQVNCTVGNRVGACGFEEQLICMRANLEWAIPHLEARALRLNIEPLNSFGFPNYLLPRSRELFALLWEWALPCIGVQYDLYHMQLMEGNLTTTMQQNLGLIGHIQVADVPGRHEPGTGEINYRHTFRRLEEMGYSNYVGLEYVPLTTTDESLAWLPPGFRREAPADALIL